MIPKYLFLVFLLLVLLAGCSSGEPLPTLDFSTRAPAVTPVPQVVPTEVQVETPVVLTQVPVEPAALSTTIPVSPPLEVPVSSEVVVVPTSVPVVVLVPTMRADALSVDDVLRLMGVALAEVETGSYELTVTSDVDVEGMGISVGMKISGDYQGADRQRIIADVGVAFFNVQVEMIVIGNLLYVKDPVTGDWGVEEGDDFPTGGFHEFMDAIRPSDLLGRMAFVGKSRLDGVEVIHLEGDIPPEVLGEAGEELESLWVRYLVGLDHHLLHNSEIRMTDKDGGVTTVAFRFFDYGKELDIRAPEVASPKPVSNFSGFDCDATLRQQLVFQRGASTAANMNELIAQLQATRSECPTDVWNPQAEARATDSAPSVDAWTGAADECWGATAITAANVPSMQIGDQKVPQGLRVQNDDSNQPRVSTGRDSDNNIIVYWSTTAANRPSDGAACWLYVSRLRSWSENY